ncbi:trypsin-like peptidase domain-containing protein [Lamprobacter modestohalophilus]|uniref:trypsin-like peptidase domain-containing protein n=1 Tax=Lamprobacter modestohalophilus TaxID=1064514 RepID=UPI001906E782
MSTALVAMLDSARGESTASDDPLAPTEAISITLPPLDATERGWVADPGSIPIPARLGFGRVIPEDGLAAALGDPQHWQATADGGQHLVLQVRSPEARALRLGLAVRALPERASLRLFTAGSDDLAPISGAEIKASLERDRAALPMASADAADAESLYWSPLLLGDSLMLELTLPSGLEPQALDLDLVRVSHLFRLPFTLPGERYQGPDDCHVDLACVDDPLLERLARATAAVLFTRSDGGSNACTGTLLADADPETRIPYLITAHHCIPDQARASSVETFWGHRAEACGAVPARQPERITGGADLLSAHESIDTVLLRLRGEPPQTAVFAHWSARLPETDTPLISVHHPHGQTAKIARGRVSHYWNCADVVYCGANADSDAIHYFGVSCLDGLTSGGSSGAGAFRADTGELVGVLTGGLSRCGSPEGPNDFGRFDCAYRAGLRRWLGR